MEAAREAFPAWSSRSPQERSLVLNRLADVLEQSLEELAQAESKDQGDGFSGRVCLPNSFYQQGLGLSTCVSYQMCMEAAVHYLDTGSENPYSCWSNDLLFSQMAHTWGKLVMSSCLRCQGSLHTCFSRQQ